jgi:imidazole glycerol-phosphate synthase subunit HisF
MLSKRFIGVVTVLNGRAVQSFGYRRYLPLGNPEVLIENLDRWGVDEIILQCIDRSRCNLGPDFELLERVGNMGLSTPLVYAGGLRSGEDAARVVKLAADRVAFDILLHDNPDEIRDAGRRLGAQALIAALPLSATVQGVRWRNYRTGEDCAIPERLLDDLTSGVISEAMVIDWEHEGHAGGFNNALLDFGQPSKVPLIAFGGISDPHIALDIFQDRRVAAVAVGNFLSYAEHSIQHFKANADGIPARPAHYQIRNWFA